MTIEEVIKKAIDGGWTMPPRQFERIKPSPYPGDTAEYIDFWLTSVFLDPLFWQSLGKALGWENAVMEIHHPAREVSRVTKHGVEKYHIKASVAHRKYSTKKWKKEQHRFIDHLAQKLTVEAFFKTLR